MALPRLNLSLHFLIAHQDLVELVLFEDELIDHELFLVREDVQLRLVVLFGLLELIEFLHEILDILFLLPDESFELIDLLIESILLLILDIDVQ